MKKLYENPDASKLTYEALYELYINQNLSLDNVAKKLEVPGQWVVNKIKGFGIVKSKSLYIKARHAHQAVKQQDLLKRVNKEEFIDLYINQNHSREFMMQYYNLSNYAVDKLIKEFECHKSQSQASELCLQTKYSKAGSKEAYYASAHEIMLNNLLARGVTPEQHYKDVSDSCKEAWSKKSDEELNAITQIRSETCQQRYGYAFSCMRPEARCRGNNSKNNQDFDNLLSKYGLVFSPTSVLDAGFYSREFPLQNRSYDFKIGHNLVEVNPTATHNSCYGTHGNYSGVNKEYHYKKSKLARDAGYRCLCLWDWDDPEKVVNQLFARKRVYARNCELKVVNLSATREYLNQHHLQGYVSCSVRLGLYYNNELVSMMTFGKPRYNKNYEYELIRYCSHYNVVGGAEKLFSYFVNNYNPESIISYCDWSKFNGDVYEKLGFTFKDYSIGKHWYNQKTRVHVLDSTLRQRGFDQLFGDVYGCFGKGTRNEDLMLQHGFVYVYDAGQASYVWRQKNN